MINTQETEIKSMTIWVPTSTPKGMHAKSGYFQAGPRGRVVSPYTFPISLADEALYRSVPYWEKYAPKDWKPYLRGYEKLRVDPAAFSKKYAQPYIKKQLPNYLNALYEIRLQKAFQKKNSKAYKLYTVFTKYYGPVPSKQHCNCNSKCYTKPKRWRKYGKRKTFYRSFKRRRQWF